MKRQHRGTRRARWAGLLAVAFGLLLIPAARAVTPPRQVLVLHSYHYGMRWAESIARGIESVFPPEDITLAVYHDFMDTKRLATEEYFSILAGALRMKYRTNEFEVVICSDDDAFRFLQAYRQRLFGDTPVVFCGVNYFREDMLEGQSNITGVVESYDLEGTLDVALRLHPGTRRFYVINDQTVTGQANNRRVDDIQALYSDRVDMVYAGDLDMDELLEQVAALPSDSLVLLMSFNRDRRGQVFRYRDAARLVRSRSPVPVYGVWAFYLGDGIVGGMLTSGFAHGQKAAQMARRILDGEPADGMEVNRHLPSQYMFDEKELRHWSINRSLLPPDSIVINRPRRVYEISRRAAWIVLGGLVAFFLSALVYGANLRARLKAQQALRRANDDLRRAIRERMAAQEDRERLASALEQTADAAVITDLAGRVLYVNPAFERITGYRAADAVGQDFGALQGLSSAEKWQHEISDAVRMGQVWSGHLVGQRKDGGVYNEEAVISPVRDAEGAIRHIVAIKRDVTEKTTLQNQLQEAQKIETVGRIAGNIAHDFNNMLTVILNSAHFLARESSANSKMGRDIEEIILTAHRASVLTRELLAFSRRQPLQTKVQDVNDIVRGMQNMLRRAMGEKAVLHLRLAEQPCYALVDKGRMEQVVANLVVNARDALEEKGSVTIRTALVEMDNEPMCDFVEPPGHDGTSFVRLSVEDNGTGMTEEVRRRIFEPFFTTKPPESGTGLGLPVVYGIVKQHGGFMALRTRVGEGSLFSIYLPVAAPAVEAGGEAGVEVSVVGGQETILMAEDESTVRDILARIIRGLGYTVFVAGSGEAALKLADEYEGRIDLLFTDVVMPGMDGPRLAQELRRRRPGLPVIFASGYSRDYLARAAPEFQAAPMLSKPFEVGGVARIIREVLDHAALSGPSSL